MTLFSNLSDLRVRSWFWLLLLIVAQVSSAQTVTIAHLSDLHLGLESHPGTEERLQQAIDLIRLRHVDAVIVSGDIGDKYEQSWNKARQMLATLKIPVYYVPGNHDDSASTAARYNKVFGKDYYTFEVKGIHFIALDSQLLGNFSTFQLATPLPIPKEDEPAAEKMLAWLNGLHLHGTVIPFQHVPPDRPSPQTSPDDKPYWILHDPWRTRELDAFRKLGVKDILAGHWHQGTIYNVDGFTIHVAPATSWSPKSPLGFAIHRISKDGKVDTEFVYFEHQSKSGQVPAGKLSHLSRPFAGGRNGIQPVSTNVQSSRNWLESAAFFAARLEIARHEMPGSRHCAIASPAILAGRLAFPTDAQHTAVRQNARDSSLGLRSTRRYHATLFPTVPQTTWHSWTENNVAIGLNLPSPTMLGMAALSLK